MPDYDEHKNCDNLDKDATLNIRVQPDQLLQCL